MLSSATAPHRHVAARGRGATYKTGVLLRAEVVLRRAGAVLLLADETGGHFRNPAAQMIKDTTSMVHNTQTQHSAEPEASTSIRVSADGC